MIDVFTNKIYINPNTFVNRHMYTEAHTGSVTARTHQASAKVVQGKEERGHEEGIYFFPVCVLHREDFFPLKGTHEK